MKETKKIKIEEIGPTVEGFRKLKEFILNNKSNENHFRYFVNRPLEVISNHISTFLIFYDGSYHGYGHLDEEGENIWLGISLSNKLQGKGISKILMKEILKSAKEKSIEEIKLSVDKDNFIAIRLYQSFGFSVYKSDKDVQYMSLKGQF